MIKLLKRSLSLLLTTMLVFLITIETVAVQETTMVVNKLNETSKIESENTVEPRVTGLIYSYTFSANKDGTKLLIYNDMMCSTSVVKSGIKEMVIQRRVSTNYAWSDYLTYEDVYEDSNVFAYSKSITVPSGYQYRVVATLYAKKSLFSTEKVEVTSNIVWI